MKRKNAHHASTERDQPNQEIGESKATPRPRNDRKARGWSTRNFLGRNKLLSYERYLHPQGNRLWSSRRINLNKPAPSPPIIQESEKLEVLLSTGHTTSIQTTTSNLKRKYDSFETIKSTFEKIKSEATEAKKLMVIKRSRRTSQSSQRSEQAQEEEAKSEMAKSQSLKAAKLPGNSAKERVRLKKKKKRQKADRRARDEEEKYVMTQKARQAEASNTGSRRFLVAIPLANISDLSGGSICKHFRKGDLALNDIQPVALESLLESKSAKAVYDSLNGPIYFSSSCEEKVAFLKNRLKSANICRKLTVVTEQHFDEVIISSIPAGTRLPRLLGEQTLVAMEQVLEDYHPPHGLESSQNSEDKIKYLFKPILRSLGLQDTIITTGFSWKEKIGLRSSTDLSTHNYGPKSDAAIIQIISEEEAKVLIPFEAYSNLGQSAKTSDDNRADRVRLLIQGSYISIQAATPSVVFYLTRDKYMETILIFPEDGDDRKFGYYAEKQPFYTEDTWIDLICQIINLV